MIVEEGLQGGVVQSPVLAICDWEDFANDPFGVLDDDGGYGAIQHNPSVSARQQRFMGAELARKRAGKKTQTGMSEQQLVEYASKA